MVTVTRVVPQGVDQPPQRRWPSGQVVWPGWETTVPYIGAVVGTLLLAVAYQVAVVPGEAGWRYPLYWAGMLAAFLPAAIRLLGSSARGAERGGLILILAIVTYLPKLLRGVGAPVFTDEMLHWYQGSLMAAGDGAFISNPIVPAISHYPMFEWLEVALHFGTGLSVWTSGVLLVGIAHVALLFGVRSLARAFLGNGRVADIAAVIYATAPAFELHTVLVSYESLGIPLAVWTMAFAVRASLAPTRGKLVAAGALAVATGMTHALSALFLLSFLLLCVAAVTVRGIRRRAVPARDLAIFGGLFGGTLAFDAVWVAAQGWNPFPYLFPTTGLSLSSFASWFSGGGSAAPGLFGGSGLPPYEPIAGLIAPVVITVLCVAGFLLTTPGLAARTEAPWLLAAIYLVYPITFLGRFNPALGEVMHRSWPYLYVGIAVLAAPGLRELATPSAPGRHRGPGGWREWLPRRLTLADQPRRVALGVAIAAVAVLLVGNTASSTNDQYRFPGPWIAGADTRSSTPDMVAAAEWLRRNAGTGARILSDKDTSDNFLGYAWAIPVTNVATWELTETTKPVSTATLRRMYQLNVQYVVVDTRMASSLNMRGYWYGNLDPSAFKQTGPFPYAAVTKLDHEPWADEVYRSTNFRIYWIDRSILASSVAPAPSAPRNPPASSAPRNPPAKNPTAGNPPAGKGSVPPKGHR